MTNRLKSAPKKKSVAPRRIGYASIRDIPPDVLKSLNEGREETMTVVEWMAIDVRILIYAIAPQVGLTAERNKLHRSVEEIAGLPVTQRVKTVGRLLHMTTDGQSKRKKVFEALATHHSDMVRAWAAFMIASDESIDLEDRLLRTRRFASDSSMSVRECAWDSIRTYLVPELERGIALLTKWVKDSNEGIRRCAIEATRPRGSWCAHIDELKMNPQIAQGLLEPVRSDQSKYVQRSVANWLNDASKSQPEWVANLCSRWLKQSRTVATSTIVNHALRTLDKATV